MPVFHSLAFRPTEMDEEYYGPFDEILREEYPTIYIFKRKVCRECYERLPEHQRFFYPLAFNHIVTNQTSALTFRDCKLCGAELYTVYYARKCSECIEAHFNFDPDDEETLRQGGALNTK